MQRDTSHPDIKVPIKTWWKGLYDEVFIAPYPFYQIRPDCGLKISPDEFEKAPLSDDFDDQIKQRGVPISWNSVHTAVAPQTPKVEFYRAVWLLACNGYQERAGIPLQKQIYEYTVKNQMYLPDDDAIPAILHRALFSFLSNFAEEAIFALDEHRTKSSNLSSELFAADVSIYSLPAPATLHGLWAIHIPNAGVLISSSFDGTEALIAMSKSALKIADPRIYFEIENVDSKTYCDWLNPTSFFEREK